MNKLSFLLLAGAAALAYHKYSKMSEEEKSQLIEKIKSKGKQFYDQVSPNVKDAFKKFS